MNHEDAELIQRWQTGETGAFEDLVRRWEPPIARFLGRLVRQPESVCDLSQEVFLRVYRARSSYRENGAFSTWLYQITLNVARDHVRQQRPLEPLPGDDLISPASDGEAISMSQEIAATVSRALADLPEPLREVLVLRHYENMNFEEIGRLLNVPASTLKSRFGTALRKLRARLRELGITGWESDE